MKLSLVDSILVTEASWTRSSSSSPFIVLLQVMMIFVLVNVDAWYVVV